MYCPSSPPSGSPPSGSPSGGSYPSSSASSTSQVLVEVPAAEVDVAGALPSGEEESAVVNDSAAVSESGFAVGVPFDLVSPPVKSGFILIED